jgi:hypothetical protein
VHSGLDAIDASFAAMADRTEATLDSLDRAAQARGRHHSDPKKSWSHVPAGCGRVRGRHAAPAGAAHP